MAQKRAVVEIPQTFGDEYGRSIAVLPFSDISREKDQEYFCEGLAEEILNALSRITSTTLPSMGVPGPAPSSQSGLLRVAAGADGWLLLISPLAASRLLITTAMNRLITTNTAMTIKLA